MLTRAISLDTYEHFSRAIEMVQEVGAREPSKLEALTARLALDVSAADRKWHAALDAIYADMAAHTEEPRERERISPTAKLLKLAKHVTLSAVLVAVGSTVEACSVDPAPSDSGFVVDPVPPDGGHDASVRDAGTDGGHDAGFVVDPPPPDAGVDAGFVVDPVPPDASASAESLRDPSVRLAEAEDDEAYLPTGALKRRLRLVDQWRDSAPRDAIRTADLPLSAPPAPELRSERNGERVRVTIGGVRDAFGTRWEAEGAIEGDGPSVTWTPSGPEDQIAVAVRTRGGVAVVTLRASGV
jgi:hypothetical protein